MDERNRDGAPAAPVRQVNFHKAIEWACQALTTRGYEPCEIRLDPEAMQLFLADNELLAMITSPKSELAVRGARAVFLGIPVMHTDRGSGSHLVGIGLHGSDSELIDLTLER